MQGVKDKRTGPDRSHVDLARSLAQSQARVHELEKALRDLLEERASYTEAEARRVLDRVAI